MFLTELILFLKLVEKFEFLCSDIFCRWISWRERKLPSKS